MTKLLYVPTGKYISLFKTGTVSVFSQGRRTLEVEQSVFHNGEEVIKLLSTLDPKIAHEVYLVRENEIKLPFLEGEIVICES